MSIPAFCTCPDCDADNRGPVIPAEHREHHGNRQTCDHGCGGEVHYSKVVGIYDYGRDRTAEWMCPSCGHRWPR